MEQLKDTFMLWHKIISGLIGPDMIKHIKTKDTHKAELYIIDSSKKLTDDK